MRLLVKLIWRDLLASPGRMAVSVFAILVSVSLIVWMMGSYDTLVREFDNDAEAYMGNYDLCLVPEPPKGPLPPGQYPQFRDQELPARLAASPLVETVNTACQVPRLQIGCGNERGSFDEQTRDRMGIPPQSPILVGNHAVECPYELKEGVWPDMASSSAMEGVLGSGSAKYFSAGVGTVMNVRVGTHVYDVKIVGIVKQAKATPGVIMGPGGMSGPAFSSLFVPVKVCEKITGQPFVPNLIYVQLKEGVDKKEFAESFRQELVQAAAAVADTDSIIRRLSSDRSVRSQKDSAEMSVWLVLFSCIFIIFTTLSIGVSERARRLALMRALGLGRMQIALLIAGEGIFLCIPALLGGLGAGFFLVYLLEEGSASAPVMAWSTVLTAAVCAVGGALLASIIPAWRASRQSPLEAAVPSSGFIGKVSRVPVWSVAAGLACVCLQPAALLLPGLEAETRKWIFFWLGYPGLVAGALFLAPSFVRVTEWAGAWITGFLLRVPHSFLNMQLSRNLSRSVGTAVSMSVGLSLFVGVQTWGYSMLVPFSPDTSTPGTLVSFLHTEFKSADVPELMTRPSLRNSRMYPIYVDEPDIAPAQMKTPGFSGMRNRSIVLAGIPVEEMTGGSHPLFNPVFVSGNPQEAYAMLESTRSLLIPDTFARAVGLKVGDDLMLVNPSSRERRPGNESPSGIRGRGRGAAVRGEPWKVAGVVSFPGWHWLTKTSGMRVRRGGFVAALAIADERWLKEEYAHQGFQFIWGDTAPGISNVELQNDLGEYALMKVRQQENGGEGARPLVKALTRESLGGECYQPRG
ncbi:ABC transporter permease [Akkermansia muciniphila]|uniref:ABC transporter permease n=1 Tax=Akkermansia muciniphila TaxID=239935 RepID=UPI0027D2DA61|nr:ABC transporter permease [Akkermansia muciniphila]WMB20241.1 ABC transporter permease [Akkermansia muciniphila]